MLSKLPGKTASLFLALWFAFGSHAACAAEPLVIKIGYNGPPNAEENAVHLFVSTFSRLVQEGTEGRLSFELIPESQLGSEEERMALITAKEKNQPMANVASFAGIAPLFPGVYASAIPFLFDNYRAAHLFFDEGTYWAKVREEFQRRTGTVLLEAIEEGGFLAFTNSKRQIRSPRDFENLTFRGMDEGQTTLFRSFGAKALVVPWTNLHTALKSGLIDGQMNPAMYIMMGRLYEVQRHMTMANIQYSCQFLVMNGALFDALSAEEQDIIRDAAREANRICRQEVEAADAEQVGLLKDLGMKVYTPNREEIAAFREIGQHAYVEWLKVRAGEEWLRLALDAAAAANHRAVE